ncbi:MAG: LysR family transcriptional regulator [Pseudomonadota bacterium]
MTGSLPPAQWLHTFAVAARHSGFAAAADELGLTPAAVSQQVRALEQRLGFALFDRLPRGVRLTEMGRAYLPAVRRAFEDLSVATSGLFGAPSGPALVVRAPLSFATLRLAPRLAAFRAAHPRVALRLCTSVWGDDIDEDRVDVDIRYGDGRWPSEEMARLTDPVSVPVCPPGTAFGADPAAALLRLADAGAIHITGCEDLWARLARQLGLAEDRIRPEHAADTSLVALEMVAAGLGCALIARDLMQSHAARLSLPPGITLVHDQAHYVLLPRRRRAPSASAVLFRNWLLDVFRCDGAEAGALSMRTDAALRPLPPTSL